MFNTLRFGSWDGVEVCWDANAEARVTVEVTGRVVGFVGWECKRDAAEGAGGVGAEPFVDAGGVERMGALRQQLQAIGGVEHGQADRAVAVLPTVLGQVLEGDERHGGDDLGVEAALRLRRGCVQTTPQRQPGVARLGLVPPDPPPHVPRRKPHYEEGHDHHGHHHRQNGIEPGPALVRGRGRRRRWRRRRGFPLKDEARNQNSTSLV